MSASTPQPRRRNLRWTCDTCGLEQTIRTTNRGWATQLKTGAHERPCLDPECDGTIRLPVKLVTCDHCATETPRQVKGGAGRLAGNTYCSHRCRGAALDEAGD